MEVQIASAVGNSRVAWFLPYSIDMVTSYGHLFSDEQPCCSVTTVCSADSCMSPCIPQVTGTVTNPNNMLLPNSTNSATVGSIFASGTHTAVFPTSVAVNGVPCGPGGLCLQGACCGAAKSCEHAGGCCARAFGCPAAIEEVQAAPRGTAGLGN